MDDDGTYKKNLFNIGVLIPTEDMALYKFSHIIPL